MNVFSRGSDELVVTVLACLDSVDLGRCLAVSRRVGSAGSGAWLWRLQLSRCFLFSLTPSARGARAAGGVRGEAWRSLYIKAMVGLRRLERSWCAREDVNWAAYERARHPTARSWSVEDLLEAENAVFRPRTLMEVFCALSPSFGGRVPSAADVGGRPHSGTWWRKRSGLVWEPLVRDDVDDPRAALVQLVLDVGFALGYHQDGDGLGHFYSEASYYGDGVRGGDVDVNLSAAYERPARCPPVCLGREILTRVAEVFFPPPGEAGCLSADEAATLASFHGDVFRLRAADDGAAFVPFWHPLGPLPQESWMRGSMPKPTATFRRWAESPSRAANPPPRRLVVAPVDVRGQSDDVADRAAVDLVHGALAAFFCGVDVVRAADDFDAVRVGPRGRRKMHRDLAEYSAEVNGLVGCQLDADAIIDAVKKQLALRRPPVDGETWVGVVDCDLYSKRAQWNFLWGWADAFKPRGTATTAGDDVVLLSLARGGARKGDAAGDPWRGTPGLAHLLVHHVRAVGHAAFGLGQCALARCCFNGVGDDEELAACPWEPCPCCLRKLQRCACGDAKQLFASLHAFLSSHAATRKEAAFLARRLANF